MFVLPFGEGPNAVMAITQPVNERVNLLYITQISFVCSSAALVFLQMRKIHVDKI
jgi:hypothetical protein